MTSPFMFQAVARAMQGYGQRKDREFEMEQQERDRAERMAAQAEARDFRNRQYADQQTQQRLQNERVTEDRALEAADRGLRPVDQVQAEGAAVQRAAEPLASSGLDSLGIGTALKAAGALSPAGSRFLVNGQSMQKARASVPEQIRLEDRAARDADRSEDRANRVTDRDFQAQQAKEAREFQARENAASRASSERIASGRLAGGAKLKQVPMGAIDDYNGVKSIHGELLQLRDILKTKAGKGAIGLKTLQPDWMLNRTDADGTLTRALVSNFSSLTFLDRSGAAVTDGEAARLVPYLLTGRETPEVMQAKIDHILQFMNRKRKQMEDSYNSETGYYDLSRELGEQVQPTNVTGALGNPAAAARQMQQRPPASPFPQAASLLDMVKR